MTPEWKAATEENLRKQNVNPIFGISSKKELSPEDVHIE